MMRKLKSTFNYSNLHHSTYFSIYYYLKIKKVKECQGKAFFLFFLFFFSSPLPPRNISPSPRPKRESYPQTIKPPWISRQSWTSRRAGGTSWLPRISITVKNKNLVSMEIQLILPFNQGFLFISAPTSIGGQVDNWLLLR